MWNKGERYSTAKRITLMYANAITFRDHEEKMWGEVFQTVYSSGLCLSWYFRQDRMKIFLNLSPDLIVWLLSHRRTMSCWCSSLIFLAGNVSPFSALRNQGWKEWCGWQVPWQYVNVELLSEGHIKWFVNDPCAVKHVCTYRSSNNFE